MRLTICLYFLWLVICSTKLLAQEPVTVQLAGFGGNDVFAMNTLLKKTLANELKQAQIDVNYFAVEADYPKYILNALSSGNAPDAFNVQSDVARTWIKTGKLAPLSENLKARVADLHPDLLKLFTYQGKLYGIPKDLNTLALVFNKDIFDDAGVPYPSNDDTWLDLKNKLKAVVEAIGDEGVQGACLTADFERLAPFAFSTGWQTYDQDYRTVLDSNFARSFRFFTSLIEEGLAVMPPDIGQQWSGGCFVREYTAVTFEGNWIVGYLRDKAPNLQYGAVLPPKDPISGQRGNILFTAGWAINADTQKKVQTEQLLALLTSIKAQQQILLSGLALPSNLTLYNKGNPITHEQDKRLAATVARAAQVENMHVFSFGPYGNQWMEPIKLALSTVMLGQTDVNTALKRAQQEYQVMAQERNQ